jgi:GMP synthase (glutamine-hydrolysing)
LEDFNPKGFVERRIEEIRETIGNGRALVAVSGGVDSTTSAVLTHKAIGNRLICVMLDDAFMRENEPKRVVELLSKPPINMPVKIVEVKERFLNALKGLRDAEEKRKAFRKTFYETLSEIAKREECSFLVQGTILADIVETKGGIKTQHNVLEQIGISPFERFGFKVVEPVAQLYKSQVRKVAKYLGIPDEIAERQPFPGPGLAVRVVGEIRVDKLETLKKATAIVEEKIARFKPGQYFAVIMDNEKVSNYRRLTRIQEAIARFLDVPCRHVHADVFVDKATGVKGGTRRYGDVIGVKVQTPYGKAHQPPIRSLIALQKKLLTENPSFTRVLYAVRYLTVEKPHVIGIRAVETQDFLEAEVSELPWHTLNEVAEQILEQCGSVSEVYYDVTPKPPATIEME